MKSWLWNWGPEKKRNSSQHNPEPTEPPSKLKHLKDVPFINAGRSTGIETIHLTPHGAKIIHNWPEEQIVALGWNKSAHEKEGGQPSTCRCDNKMNPEEVFCKASLWFIFFSDNISYSGTLLNQVLTMLMVSIMGDDLTALSLALSIAVWRKKKKGGGNPKSSVNSTWKQWKGQHQL